MIDRDSTGLAILVFLYSLHEFLLRRILWRKSNSIPEALWTTVKKGLFLLALLLVGSSGYASFALALGYLVMATVYVLYENAWTRGSSQLRSRRSLEFYVLKQVVMGVLLVTVWRLALPLNVHAWYTSFEASALRGFGKSAQVLSDNASLVLVVAAAYFFVIDGGTQVVRGILDKFPGLSVRVDAYFTQNNRDETGAGEPQENVGEWIGILERIITLTFALAGSFTAIAFALTAKSIARFEALEKSKDFAEYYLLGTSASMIAALGAGVLVRIAFGLQ